MWYVHLTYFGNETSSLSWKLNKIAHSRNVLKQPKRHKSRSTGTRIAFSNSYTQQLMVDIYSITRWQSYLNFFTLSSLWKLTIQFYYDRLEVGYSTLLNQQAVSQVLSILMSVKICLLDSFPYSLTHIKLASNHRFFT